MKRDEELLENININDIIKANEELNQAINQNGELSEYGEYIYKREMFEHILEEIIYDIYRIYISKYKENLQNFINKSIEILISDYCKEIEKRYNELLILNKNLDSKFNLNESEEVLCDKINKL
jgi:hypothetical protein